MTATATTMRRMTRPRKPPSNRTFSGRFANNFYRRRTDAGLSVKKAAELISKNGYQVSPSLVYQWEQGKAFAIVDGFPAIADAYRCTVRDLLPSH